jgi:zinc transporter 1/2/3
MKLSDFFMKFTCGLILAGITIGSGLIPLKSKEFQSSTRIMSLSNAFAGGIFLAIGLIDLMPDAQE